MTSDMISDSRIDLAPGEAALSQAERAYRTLEADIVTLDLQPGATVTEAALMERTGLGRTPVREALLRLDWEGLIDVRPRRGIGIAPLIVGAFREVLEARRPLELLLARLAAMRAAPGDRAALADCAAGMTEAARDGDVRRFLSLDKDFDALVGRAGCNAFAARAAMPLQSHSRRFWFRFHKPADLAAAAERHVGLMEAIAAGDAAAAGGACEKLMDHLAAFAEAVTGKG